MRDAAQHTGIDSAGWPCRLGGVVQVGAGRGRALGFPTANVAIDPAAGPANGVYAGWAGIDDESATRPAMIYLGSAPTFGPAARRLEVHLFDFAGDLYGRRLRVLVVARVAPERRYVSPALLAASIRHLAAATRDVLGC